MYGFGDVVLLEYPFTDLSGIKLRPAIVVLDTCDSDIVVLRATSRLWQTEFDIAIKDWLAAGLLKPTTIRVHKIAALESLLVNRLLGNLSAHDKQFLAETVCKVYGNLL